MPPAPGLGLGIRLQTVPFQRTIKVAGLKLSRLPVWPPAQALGAEVTPTALSNPPDAMAGLGTLFHAPPPQCSIKVAGFPALPDRPTAQALRAEVAATPNRIPPPLTDADREAGPAHPAAATVGAGGMTPARTAPRSGVTARTRMRRTAMCLRIPYLPADH